MGSINKTTSNTSRAFPGDYRLPTAGTATAAAWRRLSPYHGSIAAECGHRRPEQGAALGDGEQGHSTAGPWCCSWPRAHGAVISFSLLELGRSNARSDVEQSPWCQRALPTPAPAPCAALSGSTRRLATPQGVFFPEHRFITHLDRPGHVTQRLPNPRHHKGLPFIPRSPWKQRPHAAPTRGRFSGTPRTGGIQHSPFSACKKEKEGHAASTRSSGMAL